MAQLSYSFCMSLMHSLWQAAILLFVYVLIEKSLQQKLSPLQKRNLLFVSICVQIILLFSTFFFYYFNTANSFPSLIIDQSIYRFFSTEIIHNATYWLFIGYSSIVIFKLSAIIYNWYILKTKFNAGLQKPTIELKLFTTLKADHFGIKRKVCLWYSNNITTPFTFGLFKPIIVLPVALVNQLSTTQAEALILHELTHIKANDYLLNWFLLLAENVYFFNPFIISLCKKIRLEREKYCDINVIAFDYSPIIYAEALLKAQHVKQYLIQYQVAAVGKKQELLERIHFFTNKKNQITLQQYRFAFPLLTTLLLSVLGISLLLQQRIGYTKETKVQPAFSSIKVVEKTQTSFDFSKMIIESVPNEKSKPLQSVIAKKLPEIRKKIKTLQPLIKNIQDIEIALSDKINPNYISAVSSKENDETKQIVVREEQSGSKNALIKVYTLSYTNGKWIIHPEWKLAAKEIPVTDSLLNTNDTTVIHNNLPSAF